MPSSAPSPIVKPATAPARGWAGLYDDQPKAPADQKMDVNKAKEFKPTSTPQEPISAASVPVVEDDEAIISISQNVKPTFSNKKKAPGSNKAEFFGATPSQQMSKHQSQRERELTKTEWLASSNVKGTSLGTSLNDLESIDEGESFD